MALDSAIQDLVDRAAIRDLMTKYARSNDRRDFETMRTTFTAGAFADYGDWERQGVENIVGRLAYNRPHRATHFLGDQVVQIDGDSAEVETYAIAYSRIEGTNSMRMSGLRYEDKMVRQNGQWLVSHRVLVHDWRTIAEVDPSFGGKTGGG